MEQPLSDNDQTEPTVKRASVPLVKLIDGRWCWKEIGSDRYVVQPKLEQLLLGALERREQRKVA